MFTAILIALLVVATAATVVGGGLVLAAQRKRLEGGESSPKLLTDGAGNLLQRTANDLRVGDIIQHEGADFLVEGVIHYDEDGHRWRAGRLVDVDDERWLVVGMHRVGPEAIQLLKTDATLDISGYPPETIVHDGERYVLEKRGNATAKVVGETGDVAGNQALSPDSVSRLRWWRYHSAGRDCLIVEQWSGSFRALRGSVVGPGELEMIPGS